MSLCTAGTCGDGSTRLGQAGSNYTCTVTASNALGNTTSDTNAVIALTGQNYPCAYKITVLFYFTGIPSTPQISVSSSTGLMVRLLITTAYTGVPAGDNSLHINISFYNTTRGLLHQTRLDSSQINFLGSLRAVSSTWLPTSSQLLRYGSSLESELTAETVSAGEGEELLAVN